MPGISLPEAQDDITPDWLNAAVFSDTPPKVTAISASPIGEGRGLLSQTLRLNLTYEGSAADRPESLIAKLLPTDQNSLAVAAEIKPFEREIAFYRDVACRSNIRVPTIFFADMSPQGCVLIMEDLGHLSIGDQVRGIRHDRTRAAAREIAKMHAAYWDNEALHALEWAPEDDHLYTDPFLEYWPQFAEVYGLRIGKHGVEIGERVAGDFDWLEGRIASRPKSLVHGDLRGDNLLFGEPGAPDEVLILDWQLAHKSLATFDVARLLGGSEPIAERAGHQIEIFHEWHDALSRAGVPDYPADEALDDFRLAALHCLLIPVQVFKAFGAEPEGRVGRLLDVMAERFFAAAIELEAESVLPR